jgi:uncharacterized protein YqhQ
MNWKQNLAISAVAILVLGIYVMFLLPLFLRDLRTIRTFWQTTISRMEHPR